MRRSTQTQAAIIGISCLAAAAALSAVADDNATALRHQLQAQEKARALAGELVSAVLDVQLKQLQENGLATLPLFRDIAEMKQHIGTLVQGDMDRIVKLLIEAQEGTQADRLAKFNAARALAREVVVQLMAERQRLYRRLHAARLAADVRQLLTLQTRVHDTTRSLPERREDERERLALASIEDQADVNKLFYQLTTALADVSTWGGTEASAAADGLRIVKAAQVEPELKQALAALSKTDFSAAATSQRAVLKGLAALLEKIEEAQGAADADREAALQFVRELLRVQQDIREQTGQTELDERTSEPLIERQTRLQKEIGKLSASLLKFPATQSLLEQAKAASFEATAHLFEAKKVPALDEQRRVISSLAQIENALEQGLNLSQQNKSADELAADIAQLAALDKQLATAAREQTAVTELAAAKPETAAAKENDVAAQLAATDKHTGLPNVITSRLDDAKQEVAAAAKALAEKSPAAADRRQAAAEDALASIQQAQAEVAAQLADARRRQKAVKVGELARAAEALERASAAEREIARQVGELPTQPKLEPEQAATLAAEQADVAEVAERIAAGVKTTAPAASQTLDVAQQQIAAAQAALDKALQPPGDQPVSKPAADQARAAAAAAAKQLGESAKALRNAQAAAAEELQTLAADQLAKANAAREAIEDAAAAGDKLPAEAIPLVQEAKQKVAAALREQTKAEGKTKEAAAQELAEQIAALASQQNAADHAADDLAHGRANNPLDAATQEQSVADQAEKTSQTAPPEIAAPLRQAARSAADAARETLGGNSSKAAAARQQTRQSLAKAQQLADQQTAAAAKSPAGKPDAQAENNAAARAAEAQQLLQKAGQQENSAASEASKALAEAQQNATHAKEQLDAGRADEAAAAQKATRDALAQAGQKLNNVLKDLASRQAAQLAREAQQSRDLMQQALAVDPAAAAALKQGQKAAARGAQAGENPREAARAGEAAQQKMNEALANIAAREQQLRRHRELAEALAALAGDQNAAREAIDSAVNQLQKSPPTSKPTAEQLAAAGALAQAQQQFAAAQTTTGEGAVEISGQQEVANKPIREGLQIASRLGRSPTGAKQPGNESPEPGDEPATPDKTAQATAEQNPKSKIENPKSAAKPNPNALGTKLVPNAPQITAQQIAGPKANAAAAAMAAAMKGKGQPGQNEGESETPMEGAASSTAKKGGASKGGKSAANQKPPQGQLEKADAADADSRGQAVSQDASKAGDAARIANEPWFAKLPPHLQSAIQGRARTTAPRGYEERLKRYFESVD